MSSDPPPLRVVIVNHGGDFAASADSDAVLAQLRTLTDWAEALATAGADVTVVQGAHRDERLSRRRVDYRLLAGPFTPYLSRRRIPFRLHRVVARLAPDVVHLNGLLYGLQARFLRRALPPGTALVMQHHGEPPDRGLAAIVQRWGLRAADGFFFTATEMAEPWRARGLVRRHQPVFPIPEGSSRLRPMERQAARAHTGMTGDPIFLWAANLDPNKDPITILEAFEAVLQDLPKARLYMAWRRGSLLAEVQRRLAESPILAGAVELLGTLPYERLEPIFNSADFLLQGSNRESCGFAIADALACGTVPIVTDIPAFRALTANGSHGALFPPGDPAALRQAILTVTRRPLPPQRQAARKHFERHLNFPSIAQQATRAYRQLRIPHL